MMFPTYDICVDYAVLNEAGRRLQNIGNSLHTSVVDMEQALRYSEGFLAGEQFERTKKTTENCLRTAGKTENNIRYSLQYLKELLLILDEYQKCSYNGENS